jgi:hypothetical protein
VINIVRIKASTSHTHAGAPGEAAAHAALAATVPSADEPLRTLYVANISPMVPVDRLRELFGIFGVVQDMEVGWG